MSELYDKCREISRELVHQGFTLENSPDRQAIALGEEVGEFLGAYRRWRNQARRTDTLEHVVEELADVIITAHVTAAERDWPIEEAIEKKIQEIWTRGWREHV